MKIIVLLLTIFVTSGIWSCGSKKEFARSNTVENLRSNAQLYAELYRTTRLLQLLDVKIRQIETRDLSGNVRIETEADISKKTELDGQDSTKVTVSKQEEVEKVVNSDQSKERSGVMGSWVWIIGFMAIIVVALVAGIYIVKK